MPRQTRQTRGTVVKDEPEEVTKPKRRKKAADIQKDTGSGPSGDTKKNNARGRKRKDDGSGDKNATIPVKKGKTLKKEPDSEPSTSVEPEEKGEIKKIIFSGSVPVDENCTQCSSSYHVYIDKENKTMFNAMLNQTNIGSNNNKYYLLQLLEHNSNFEYATWFRWGRVGKVAGSTLTKHGGNLEAAKQMFGKKFRDKTGNSWFHLQDGGDFQKFPGKYDLLEVDFGEEEEAKKPPKDTKKEQKPKKEIESKLDKRVQEVIDLIFNIQEFESCVKEMEFDVKKAPLGKLTTKQIKAGYEALKKVEKCIQNGNFGRELQDACSEFYTRIPHNFGMKVPPLIRTPQQLKLKIQLLEALGDIQIAVQMISEDENEDDINIKDSHYKSLGCKLQPFDEDHDEYKLVEQYVKNSHGSTHSHYNLKVENIYEVERGEDSHCFKKDIGNRMLLWHGSRLTNWCGILKQGLRIAPPEAPATGYMFGKGVYFADVVSKSANYCFANKRQPLGFLLLCEVALGETNEKEHGDYNANRLPKGKSSTKGLGQEVPDPAHHKYLSCGTLVPLGKPRTPNNQSNLSLMYNEYIVYDVAQIRPRYLVKVKFDFKSLW